MKITYIHHSAFLVETESAYLLFDYFKGQIPELRSDRPLVIFASQSQTSGSFFKGDL